MKISTKTTIILLSAVVLGVIIGVLGSGLLHKKRYEKIQTMDPGQRFKEVLFDIIKPDKIQRQAIEDILKEQTAKISLLEEDYQGEVYAIFDSTKIKIKSILTEKQLEEFEKEMNKGHERIISRRINHLKKSLQLSDEQYKEIYQIVKETEMAKPFFFQSNQSRRERRQMREMLMKKIETVLTPEQIKRYHEMQRRGMGPRFTPPETTPHKK